MNDVPYYPDFFGSSYAAMPVADISDKKAGPFLEGGDMIVCEESFADGIPEAFGDRDRITVPEKDAEHPAINGLPVNPEVCITDVAFKDSIGKQSEDRVIAAENLDFSATRANYGSVHCSTQPV